MQKDKERKRSTCKHQERGCSCSKPRWHGRNPNTCAPQKSGKHLSGVNRSSRQTNAGEELSRHGADSSSNFVYWKFDGEFSSKGCKLFALDTSSYAVCGNVSYLLISPCRLRCVEWFYSDARVARMWVNCNFDANYAAVNFVAGIKCSL